MCPTFVKINLILAILQISHQSQPIDIFNNVLTEMHDKCQGSIEENMRRKTYSNLDNLTSIYYNGADKDHIFYQPIMQKEQIVMEPNRVKFIIDSLCYLTNRFRIFSCFFMLELAEKKTWIIAINLEPNDIFENFSCPNGMYPHVSPWVPRQKQIIEYQLAQSCCLQQYPGRFQKATITQNYDFQNVYYSIFGLGIVVIFRLIKVGMKITSYLYFDCD